MRRGVEGVSAVDKEGDIIAEFGCESTHLRLEPSHSFVAGDIQQSGAAHILKFQLVLISAHFVSKPAFIFTLMTHILYRMNILGNIWSEKANLFLGNFLSLNYTLFFTLFFKAIFAFIFASFIF